MTLADAGHCLARPFARRSPLKEVSTMTAPQSQHTPAVPASAAPFSIATGWRAMVAAMTPDDGTVSISIPTRDGHLVQIMPRFGRPQWSEHARDRVEQWVGWRVYVFDRPAGRASTSRSYRLTGPDRRYRSELLTDVAQVEAEVDAVLRRWPVAAGS